MADAAVELGLTIPARGLRRHAPCSLPRGRLLGRRVPARRACCAGSAIAGGVGLVYLLAANLFLRLGGVQMALAGADEVQVTFRASVVSLAWARPHRGFRIAFEDRNLQFSIEIPHVDVTVQLRALLRQTFYATQVNGSGLVFRVRKRVDPREADRPVVRAFPPVNDFDDRALYISGPPPPPRDHAHFHPWTLHIENVDVEVHELWVQMFRYQGTARATGAFRLVPATRPLGRTCYLRFASGSVVTGPYDLVTNVAGTVDCTVHDFDVQGDVLPFISMKIVLANDLPPLRRSASFRPGSLPWRSRTAVECSMSTSDSREACSLPEARSPTIPITSE